MKEEARLALEYDQYRLNAEKTILALKASVAELESERLAARTVALAVTGEGLAELKAAAGPTFGDDPQGEIPDAKPKRKTKLKGQR